MIIARLPRFPLFILLTIGSWFAYHNAFIQDDAYISYVYAKHFAQGHGLVWYPGSTEFGYTNFFYTFMIGVAMLMRIPPDIASNFINVSSFLGCLIVGNAICTRVLGSRFLGFLPMFLLATHHTFTAYATGGLETMWVTLLILTFYWHILTHDEREREEQYVKLGTIAAIALLSRLDTPLLLLPGYVFLMFSGMRRRTLQSMIVQVLRMRDAIIIPTAVLAGFMLCCYMAYGHILPNTFYIKMPGDDGMLKFGVNYLWLYNMLHLYLPFFVPFFLLYFCFHKGSLRKLGGFTLMMSGIIVLWLSFIAYVGGDFMEFRFLVPVLLFYYLAVFRLILALVPKHKAICMALVFTGFLAGNALHPTLFRTQPGVLDFNNIPRHFQYAFVESTDSLHEWLTVDRTNWIAIGKGLRKLLYTGHASDVKIAVGNTGAIPYYSELPVFDLLGLNSRSVLGNYRFDIERPGHSIVATDALLKNEGVVLNMAFPRSVCKNANRYVIAPNPVGTFPSGRHETLFVPLDNGCYVVADYITPHPKVEELLRRKIILRYRDVAKDTDCPNWLCLR